MDPSSRENDADKMGVEEARRVSRIMLVGGAFLLPLLWLVNVWYFRRHLRSGGDAHVRRHVLLSLLGGLLFLAAALAWYLSYALSWSTWGPLGESLALVLSWGPQ